MIIWKNLYSILENNNTDLIEIIEKNKILLNANKKYQTALNKFQEKSIENDNNIYKLQQENNLLLRKLNSIHSLNDDLNYQIESLKNSRTWRLSQKLKNKLHFPLKILKLIFKIRLKLKIA